MDSLVFPFHDPKNIESGFIPRVTPILKENFDSAFISLTPKTVESNPAAVQSLQQDKFYILNYNGPNTGIGDHFLAAYKNALADSPPDKILHLCTFDRLSFALLTDYKNTFLHDIKNIHTPTMFLRSARAWKTHPLNYHAAESMVTRAGELLFNTSLDFTWCHLTLTASQLKTIIPSLKAHDLVIFAEIAYYLKDILQTKEVDWLSWEDPFIMNKDAAGFKKEREQDPGELQKRLSYVLPMINFLFEKYQTIHHS